MFVVSGSTLRRRAGAVAAVVVIAAGTACSSKSSPSQAATTTTSATVETIPLDQKQVVVRGRAAVSDQITIEADDNYFTPNVLTAKPGTSIALHVVNHGAALHNISVTEQGLDHDLAPKDSFDATIDVPASGQVLFFCRIHRDETGMEGVINPVADSPRH